ncbi:MAG: 2-dehydropantoate 2-reductase [Candidatus Poribacteria bacterium]|nr:2-dehydropantoate 2-reductase [Candidatus Poribacteria bacterium]
MSNRRDQPHPPPPSPHPNPPPQGEGIQTGEGIRLPVITERTADTPDFDAILFLTKSMSTRAAAERAKPFQSPQTVAVTLQNGIGNAEVLAEVFGAENVLVGTTREGATLLEEGVARYAGTGATRVGAMRPARIEDAHLFVKLLTDCGFEAEYADDWESAVWLKAILNAAINPLTALLGVANGKLAEWDSAREVMLSLARECVAVAKARGINLPDSSDDSVDEMVVDVCRRSATNRSSMLQDLDNGRRTELEFFNGVILREAERLRLDTPTLRTVTLLARAREQATLSSGGTP